MLQELTQGAHREPTGEVIDEVIVAHDLRVVDAGLVQLAAERDGPEEVGVLCQDLLDLGVAAYRVTDADRELRRIDDAASRFETAVETTVEDAVKTVTIEFEALTDPEDGTIAEVVTQELERILEGLGDAFDPDDKKSVLSQIESVVTDAAVEATDSAITKMRRLVDPSAEGSPMANLQAAIVRDLSEPLKKVSESMTKVERLIAVERAVDEEADKGTAKGRSFEDLVGVVLGDCALSVGDEVARTSDESGHDGTDVGDYVTTATAGGTTSRIAWEVKDRKDITRPSALVELNSAAINRDATVSVMVVSHDSKLTNGAPFVKLAPARYVVTYDKVNGEDLALKVMYQVARFESLAVSGVDSESVDLLAIAGKIEETRALLNKVSTIKGDLSSAQKGIDAARNHVDEMKAALMARLDELDEMVVSQ